MRTLHKKGDTTLLQMIFGTIIALMLLITLIKVGVGLIGKKDYEQSFRNFAAFLEEMNGYTEGATDSFMLELDDRSAIIGINPPATTTNGRFGDGGFHYILSLDGKNDGNLLVDRYHYLRPSSCGNSGACVCLCMGVEAAVITDEYWEALKNFDEAKPTLYTNLPSTSAWSEEFTKDKLNVHTDTKNNDRVITCKREMCEPLENVNFYAPLLNTYYGQEWRKLPDATPAYVFEQGFAIYRNQKSGDGSTTSRILGYDDKIPESSPVFVSKLPNQNLAVCMAGKCVAEITGTVGDDMAAAAMLQSEAETTIQTIAGFYTMLRDDPELTCFFPISSATFTALKGQLRVTYTTQGAKLSYEDYQEEDVGTDQPSHADTTIEGIKPCLIYNNDDKTYAENFYNYWLELDDDARAQTLGNSIVVNNAILRPNQIYYYDSDKDKYFETGWTTAEDDNGNPGDYILYKHTLGGATYMCLIPTYQSASCNVRRGLISDGCFDPDNDESLYALATKRGYVMWQGMPGKLATPACRSVTTP